MSRSGLRLRPAELEDRTALWSLHRIVAAVGGGIARTPEEITPEFVEGFLARARATGIALVALDGNEIVGEIHASRMVPNCFSHILADLTIVVAPPMQGRGVGRALFTELLRIVTEERPEFRRVELWVRASNTRGIRLYESLGFSVACRVPDRIRSGEGFETDVLMCWSRQQG